MPPLRSRPGAFVLDGPGAEGEHHRFMQLRVTQFGEPVLHERGQRITRFDNGLHQLIADMVETMYAEEGIGLAAQQVGRPLLLFVIDLQVEGRELEMTWTLDGKTPPLELIMPLAVVNPEVELLPSEPLVYEEGCLSFPNIRGDIERPTRLRMKYQDPDGNPHVLETDGLLARVIQHEYDHTQGILFIDRMTPGVLQSVTPKLKKLKRHTRDFLKKQEKAMRNLR